MTLLTVNDDVTLPGAIVCLDVQTIDEPDQINPHISRKRLRCWSAVAGRIENDQWTREKTETSTVSLRFWEWLNFVRVIHRPLWIFCAGARCSLTTLGAWKLMESGEFRLNRHPTPQVVARRKRKGEKNPNECQEGLLVDTGPPTIVVFYHKTGWKVVALDSANYFSSTSAGNAPGETSRAHCVPSQTAPLANWLQHSTDNVACLKSQIVDLAVWHRKQELGRFGFTVSAIALAGFRHRFMHTQPDCPDDQDERDFEREAFYQGRVEAFWAGTVESGRYSPVVEAAQANDLFSLPPAGPFHLVDARSMYGAIGAFCELPVKCIAESEVPCDPSTFGGEPRSDLLATVAIDSPHGEFPVRHNGRTVYATGEFVTTLCGAELQRAFRDGVVTRVHRWRQYDMALIFRPFSLAIWEERLRQTMEGNSTLGSVCKALLARLHGKFLQRAARWENRPEVFAAEPFDQWIDYSATTGKTRRFRSVAWDVQEEVDAGDAPHCFPAIAAFVTAHAREWLRSWILMAGERNVLYVATDSLIVTEEGKVNLEKAGIIGDYGIGSLRVVQTSRSVVVRGIADFEIGTKRAHGGVSICPESVMETGYCNVQLDSLETVLFVRRGVEIQTATIRQDRTGLPRGKQIHAGGWLEAQCLTIRKQLAESTNSPFSNFSPALT